MNQKQISFDNIPNDLKGLEGLVLNSKPEELLATLRDAADFLYRNLGTPADWAAVANYLNRTRFDDTKAGQIPELIYVHPIWRAQGKLDLLHTILYNTKGEQKVKEIYELIAGKKAKNGEDADFSLFYDQLNNLIDVSANLLYGLNLQADGGRVRGFTDYAVKVKMLRHILTLGVYDCRTSNRHSGLTQKTIVESGQPVGQP